MSVKRPSNSRQKKPVGVSGNIWSKVGRCITCGQFVNSNKSFDHISKHLEDPKLWTIVAPKRSRKGLKYGRGTVINT